MAVIYELSHYARVLVPDKTLQPSLLFVGKARSLSYPPESFFNRVGSRFTNKHWTRMERLARETL
jgi:hypothetical protein